MREKRQRGSSRGWSTFGKRDYCAAEKRTWLADTHRGNRARFDAALGLALVAPSCASSASAWYLRCCDGEEEGQSGPRANVLGRFGKQQTRDDPPTLYRLLRSLVLGARGLERTRGSAQEQAGVPQPPVRGFHGARSPAACAALFAKNQIFVKLKFMFALCL
jgi:hypothetical protein